MERYRLRLTVTRTFEADVEVDAGSLVDATEQVKTLDIAGRLIQVESGHIEVVSVVSVVPSPNLMLPLEQPQRVA